MSWDEEAQQRMALYRARFLSWQIGKTVQVPDMGEPHWYHRPLLWADTGQPVTRPAWNSRFEWPG